MDEKLRLIRTDKLDYKVPVPKRMHGIEIEATVRFAFKDGEYQYFPRKHNFMCSPRFTYTELEAILNELKILNGIHEAHKKT